MQMDNYTRFLNDIRYDLLLPPHGINYAGMTPKVAKEAFEWFVSKIPERMVYFRSRCAYDLNISIDELDYSEESLLLVWKWFLRTARTEDTPDDLLAQMKEKAKIFGSSYINYQQLTPVTHFILRDIAMYVGECYIRNYPCLYWSYRPKPKSSITVNQPVVAGMISEGSGGSKPMFFAVIHMVGVQGGKILMGTQKESDLYNVFLIWKQYIPMEHTDD
jgi:hypothetical protein